MYGDYSKYLELLKKRYIRNGIVELGDLDVEVNKYELISVLSDLEDINKYLAIATDNNPSLQLLAKDYITFYESLRRKVVEEYNNLYDERIEELYTSVLNQVKIGTVEDDYRVVSKDVRPYVLGDVGEPSEVELTPRELQEVKVLATVVQDERPKDLEIKGESNLVDVITDLDDLGDLDEGDAELFGFYDDDDDFEDLDDLDDEDDFEDAFDVGGIAVKGNYMTLGGDVDLPKGLKRDFSLGLDKPIKKSDFVPRRSTPQRDFKGTEGINHSKKLVTGGKMVETNQNFNERMYDKLDNFSGALVDRLVKKIK
jgi:hypothetical protein